MEFMTMILGGIKHTAGVREFHLWAVCPGQDFEVGQAVKVETVFLF